VAAAQQSDQEQGEPVYFQHLTKSFTITQREYFNTFDNAPMWEKVAGMAPVSHKKKNAQHLRKAIKAVVSCPRQRVGYQEECPWPIK
jgi:hypothetical protein